MTTSSIPGVGAGVLQSLCQFDTCTLSNALELIAPRLLNEGFTTPDIRCLFPSKPVIAAHAVTLRIRTANPPPTGHTFRGRSDWWDEILRIPEPRIVVIDDTDRIPGMGALIGEVHANILRALAVIGVLTNGVVRDLNALEVLPFQVFSAGTAVSHAYAHIIEVGSPVVIGNLLVKPGDVLVGDRHGILSVPNAQAEKLPLLAQELRLRDSRIIEFCRDSRVTIGNLQEFIKSLASSNTVANHPSLLPGDIP